MNKTLLTLAIVALLATIPATAMATTIELQPTPPDLYDLTHQNYYTWGFGLSLGEGEVISSASLFFKQIWDWTPEPNVLYVHLLDSAPLGVSTYWDWENPTDAFAGQGTDLVTYTNLPAAPQNITYNFDAAQIAALAAYAADGVAALGIDPDCHFYNCGIKLTIETTPVIPEPSSLALAGIGIAGLATITRRYR